MKTTATNHDQLIGKTVTTTFNGRVIEGRIVDTVQFRETGNIAVAINPYLAQDVDIVGKWIAFLNVVVL